MSEIYVWLKHELSNLHLLISVQFHASSVHTSIYIFKLEPYHTSHIVDTCSLCWSRMFLLSFGCIRHCSTLQALPAVVAFDMWAWSHVLYPQYFGFWTLSPSPLLPLQLSSLIIMARSWSANEAKSLSHDLLAIFDDNTVSARFREFCQKNGVITPTDLAAACPREEDLKEELLEATEFQDIGFQEKKDIRKAWLAARGRMGQISSSSSAPAAAPPRKMPDGAETRLRSVWKNAHGINLSGAWLTTEPVMTLIYLGLHNSNRSLHVPDIATVLRKSSLNQKPAKGTLITDHGIEQLDYTMSPCTNHPEFWLRVRAYIMTIAFVMIDTPDFFSFESAIDLCDYIFEAINCRPDGRRPGLVQLNSCFLAMFGDYAKALQNEGTSFEAWLSFKGNWQHIWRDSASADAMDTSSGPGNLHIADDLTNMLKTNSAVMKGMQSSVDRKLSLMQEALNKQSKGGGKSKNKQQKRQYWSQNGPDRTQGSNGSQGKGGGKSTGPNAAQKKQDKGYTKRAGKNRR